MTEINLKYVTIRYEAPVVSFIYKPGAELGFPEIKELKQIVRDVASPGKSLGHADTKPHHIDNPGDK